MNISKTLKCAAFSTALVLAGWQPAAAQEEQNYLLGTASTGGTFYAVGVALATLVKIKLQPEHNIGMSAISSAGSGENIALMRDGQAQFSILQGLFGAYAARGTGDLEEQGVQENLRSIASLWPNVEHFMIPANLAETGTMDDVGAVTGEGAALGARNSGALGSNETILRNLGYEPESDFSLQYGGFNPAVEALQNGQVMLASTPGGAPVSAVTQAYATMGADNVAVLNFTDEQMQEANGDLDLWTRYVVPAETYPGQSEDINTIAQPNLLAVNSDVPEETVYLITKAIYENLAFLQSIHPATNEMTIDNALAGLPLPLHPGALRYFEEVGAEIPDRLRPE
ncbi:TAXI family TRAP transporter solute-binding subunit [Pararhizobium haloflavum]|uniref:TAXI family TRAP transporter solute-binding subunit n=1 Tax=Pararhizobium haloflavum TaxID=2037914 RepID=UPI0018E447FF|nr:TAXI family TRAP transporter solute-binding subunit [Pararhizobium haloflavum]